MSGDEGFFILVRHSKIESVIIPTREEYPNIPCGVKGVFEDPIIIKVVAVMSKNTPSVRKVSSKLPAFLVFLSLKLKTE
jgi:hypothetical protein